MGLLTTFVDRFRGQGEAAITVPVLDGPLMPNRALDERLTPVVREAEVDNLVDSGAGLLYSRGCELRRIDEARTCTTMHRFESEITAVSAERGAIAVGLAGSGLRVMSGRHAGARVVELEALGVSGTLNCVTALAWIDEDELVVANGSAQHTCAQWRWDLLTRGASGCIVRINLATRRASLLASRLAWPWGVVMGSQGRFFFSESWRHRIVSGSLDGAATTQVLQEDLPAYPARMSRASGGGFWLTCVSIRNQLVEFILREPEYCQRMMNEVPEPYWMAPSLVSGLSFKEPMQQNQLRQMGIMKPWAPTRSYGLVIRCDESMRPTESFHSRADGHVHGVTAACDVQGELFVCARGAGLIGRMKAAAVEKQAR